MKYESELIKEIVDSRGHDKSSLHYESECIESWIEEAKGAYPKLCDYQSEWLEYISILDDTGGGKDPEPPIGGGEEPEPEEPPIGGGEEPEPEEPPIGKFPYETVTTNNTATVNHVVPFEYKSAILKGQTDENLQSVQMPVLMMYTHENLFKNFIKDGSQWGYDYSCTTTDVNYNQNGGYVKIIGGGNLGYSGFVSPSLSRGTYKFSCKVKVGKVGDLYRIVAHSNPNASWNTAEGFASDKIKSTKEIETFERVGYFKGGNNMLLYAYYKGQEIDYYDIMFTKLSDEDVTNDVQNYTYQSNILTVNEDVTLRSNGDVSDELDLLTGKLTQRIGEDGEVLTQESVKTVDLTVVNQDEEPLSKIKPIEGTMHVTVSGTPINPTAVLEVPVEAITQNLNSFIGEE